MTYNLKIEQIHNIIFKGFQKACKAPKLSNEIKYTNEKMTWNAQDTKLSRYVSKADVGKKPMDCYQ